MGWASGSELLTGIILSTKIAVPPKHRKELYKLFINQFETVGDCDTIDECLGHDKEFDKAFYELYPDWDEEH